MRRIDFYEKARGAGVRSAWDVEIQSNNPELLGLMAVSLIICLGMS